MHVSDLERMFGLQIYYHLSMARQSRRIRDVVLVRLEQIAPFPHDLITRVPPPSYRLACQTVRQFAPQSIKAGAVRLEKIKPFPHDLITRVPLPLRSYRLSCQTVSQSAAQSTWTESCTTNKKTYGAGSTGAGCALLSRRRYSGTATIRLLSIGRSVRQSVRQAVSLQLSSCGLRRMVLVQSRMAILP